MMATNGILMQLLRILYLTKPKATGQLITGSSLLDPIRLRIPTYSSVSLKNVKTTARTPSTSKLLLNHYQFGILPFAMDWEINRFAYSIYRDVNEFGHLIPEMKAQTYETCWNKLKGIVTGTHNSELPQPLSPRVWRLLTDDSSTTYALWRADSINFKISLDWEGRCVIPSCTCIPQIWYRSIYDSFFQHVSGLI